MIKLFLVILCIIVALILYFTREPESLIIVKQRYIKLLDYLNTDECPEKFYPLRDYIIITGRTHIINGDVGYNTNKGLEIGICIGDPNDMFHVLLHELAHSTVREYSHSKEFWENFNQLKEICVKLGIYTRITQKRRFCNKYIVD